MIFHMVFGLDGLSMTCVGVIIRDFMHVIFAGTVSCIWDGEVSVR